MARIFIGSESSRRAGANIYIYTGKYSVSEAFQEFVLPMVSDEVYVEGSLISIQIPLKTCFTQQIGKNILK